MTVEVQPAVEEEPITVPGTVLLSGIVGSQAYGLATPDSDVDRLGMFAVPTTALHGLKEPRESVVLTEPSNHTFHEAAKFCRLMLKGNPSVTELLWLPEDLYETRTGLGRELIRIRGAFLSAPRVRAAYLGYARGQFTRNRTAKQARHLLRLLYQGFDLYSTGHLTVRLADPGLFHDFGDAAVKDPTVVEAQLATFEAKFAQTPSALPKEPDVPPIEDWLQRVRRNFF